MRLFSLFVLIFCIFQLLIAEEVQLETGAVGWLFYPEDPQSKCGALLFHGANSKGANQPSATALRNVLLDAGYVVFALDHPGYGKSPLPRSWDPTPARFAALEYLSALPSVEKVIVVGHSMGSADALCVLRDQKVQAGFLLGASVRDGAERNDYWYRRFHKDRNIPQGTLCFDQFVKVRDTFYNTGYYARMLGSEHAPIVFIRFEKEYINIAQGRDHLFEIISGKKLLYDLKDTDHDLSETDRFHEFLKELFM